MDALGWDSCDIIIVTGDAYVDHPSFGMAVIGRVLEAQGFRVGIIAQPDWHSARAVQGAGQAEPVLRRHRRQHGFDDQPLHGGPQDPQRRRLHAGRRGRQAAGPRRRSCTRSAAAKPSTTCPIVIGGIEAQPAPHRALRLLAGQGAPLDPASMPSATCCCTATPSARSSRSRTGSPQGEPVQHITDVRGTAFVRAATPEGWFEIDSTDVDTPGPRRGRTSIRT